MQRALLCTLLILAVAVNVHATPWDDIVEQAFDAMVDDMDESLAYTETRSSNEGETVARYDPRLAIEERWNLISVNGKEPSDEEVSDFRKRKNETRDNESEDDDSGIASIVADGGLTLVEETDEHWLFGFKPAGDTDEDKAFMESVDGTLLIIKNGHYVSEIRLQNSKPIKPGKGVKIQEFRITMVFAPIETDGPTAPLLVRSAVKGRAMFVISIDENDVIGYSEHELVAENQSVSVAPGSPAATLWHWTGTLTPVEKIEVVDPSRYTLMLGPQGRAEILFDCNRGHGSYEISDHNISFGMMISTRMACPNDSQDAVFMKQLAEIVSFFIRDGVLYLEMPMDAGTMRFVAADNTG